MQNTIVVRCARISSRSRGCTCGQMLVSASGVVEAERVAVAPATPAVRAPGSVMSSTGTITSTSSALREPASTIVTGRGAVASVWPPRKRAISSSGRCVADSPMRCGGASAIASSRSSDSARCAPRLVGASAWISSTITVSTLRSDLARLRREHQVERLGRGDEDVGRGARERAGAPCAGVSPVRIATVGGVNADAEPFGRERDAGERRAQVLLDVDGEGAQRRDVEHAAALRPSRGTGRVAEPVDRPEERGERLARAGGREEQRVVAGRDRGPALRLGVGGRGEARLEPGPDGRGEAVQRHRTHGTGRP